MDPSILAWVIEFIIRHNIPAPFLNPLLADPYFSFRDINIPRLKKILCLRNIQDEISDDAISSEKVLELLEIIEEIDRKDGNLIIHSMKLAYRAVAVACTLKYFQEEGEGKFFEAVKRIWIDRIENLELSKKSELITEELRAFKEEILSAVWNRAECERLLAKNGEIEAVRSVRLYVEQALDIMGPSFVDLAASAEVEMKLKRKRGASSQDLKPRRIDGDEVEMEEGNESNADSEQVVIDRPDRQDGDRLETEEGNNADADPDPVVLQRPASPQVECSPDRSCDTMDSPSVETGIPSTKFSLIPTPEVVKARESLNYSCMELKALVNDPLPEALRVSDNLRAGIRGKSLNKETSVQNLNGTDKHLPSPTKNAEVSRETTEILNPVPSQVVQNMRTNAEIPVPIVQGAAPKGSLMERNKTACTFEWSDSIDGMSQETANSMDKDKIPTENCRTDNLVGRKRRKRWSAEEEEGLREGVKKFGVGNWALILKSKRELFIDRKSVDLKDKWRNLTKLSE